MSPPVSQRLRVLPGASDARHGQDASGRAGVGTDAATEIHATVRAVPAAGVARVLPLRLRPAAAHVAAPGGMPAAPASEPADAAVTARWLPAAVALLRRDLRIAARRRIDTLAALVFFVLVASLFPLGIGADANQLRPLAGGVAWVSALLSALLAMPRLFGDDHADGTLEQWLLSPLPLWMTVLSKVTAHWLSSGLLLVLASPLLALQYGLSAPAAGVLALSLLVGTPLLSLLMALGAALTVGLRGAALLLPLIVLPLCVPVLVFGAGTVESFQAGLGVAAHLSLLGAGLLVALALVPWAAAQSLRIAVEA